MLQTNVNPNQKLIRTFEIKGKGGKTRKVNDPIPELKELLKDWNEIITQYYVEKLDEYNLSDIAQAYLPGKSIVTNARIHKDSPVIQFDFKGFYDSCKLEYFVEDLCTIDDTLHSRIPIVEKYVIDPQTKGVTQGLPVSGALAGLSLIPFWKKLKESLPSNIVFTQYSDDLTFSYKNDKPDIFDVASLSEIIKKTLSDLQLDFCLNDAKTRAEERQWRKITGVRINHDNETTCSRKDYRFLRHCLYILSKSNDLEQELSAWGFPSKASFSGKISYMRSIDSTGKIQRIIDEYAMTCRKHNIFTTWLTPNPYF